VKGYLMILSLPVGNSGRDALVTALECAQEAGKILLRSLRGRSQVWAKGRRNFVTAADVEAQEAVLALIRQEFPTHAILAEEGEGVKSPEGAEWVWVIDPLDGTHNFSRAIPHFCFNIALCHRGAPLLAVTYDPLRGERFVALAGEGGELNGAKLQVGTPLSLSESLIGFDLGYDDEKAFRLLQEVIGLWPNVLGLRLMGSAALGLAYAACGRLDVYVHCNVLPWDVCAGILLVQEAGGLALDWEGRPAHLHSSKIVAGAPRAVRELVARLQAAQEPM